MAESRLPKSALGVFLHRSLRVFPYGDSRKDHDTLNDRQVKSSTVTPNAMSAIRTENPQQADKPQRATGKEHRTQPVQPRTLPISVVILTHDEEVNIGGCLASVVGWAGQVFVVDSGSSDRTVEIASGLGATVVEHAFEGYSKQRDWALEHLPLAHDWVFTLDADERISPELIEELHNLFGGGAEAPSPVLDHVSGFYVKRKLIFMGRWIRRGGYYPIWLLRLYRRSHARWDGRSVNEHVHVDGATARLQHDILHQDQRPLTHWIAKHNGYATLEAGELQKAEAPVSQAERGAQAESGSLWGSQADRKRWLRNKVWNRLPPVFRPFLYFTYRFVLLSGFLDGRAGLIYHVFQGLWYPLLIDAKYLEAKGESNATSHEPSRPGRTPAPITNAPAR